MYQSKRVSKKLLQRVMAGVACGAFCFSSTGLAAESEATSESSQAAIQEYMLEDIVVTAQRIPTKKMDTPARVEVVTETDIKDNHYRDVAEAISNIDGVSIDRTSGGEDQVTINGDQRVLILVDGQRMNDDQGVASGRASASLAMIPSMKNIERIEVVRGGGSALYGSEAVGGVINIITKKGERNLTTIDLNGGSWGTYTGSITNEGSDGTFSWMVTAGMEKQGNVRFKYDGQSKKADNSGSHGNNVAIRLDHKIDEESGLRLNYSHRSMQRWTWEGNSYLPNPYGSAKQTFTFNNISAQYDFKKTSAAPGYLRIFQNYKSVDNYGKFNTKMRGIDYQNGWKLNENNTLIAGAEYHISSSSNVASGYEDKKINNFAVYVQDTMKLGKQWTFVPGVRFDKHNKAGSNWAPKAALNYNADDKTQVYLSWGRVFKAPTADDLYYNQDWGWGTGYFGNPNLKPEKGYTTTFGATHKFDNTSEVNFSMFYSKLRDPITWYNSAPWRYDAANLNWEKRRGLDLSFSKKFSNGFSAELGYSYIGTESGYAEGYNPVDNYAGKTNRQPNAYRLALRYKKGAWKTSLTGKYIAGLQEDYFLKRKVLLADFNLSYDFNKQGTVYFKINNLFNREYSKAVGAIPGLGRFFQLGVTYSF